MNSLLKMISIIINDKISRQSFSILITLMWVCFTAKIKLILLKSFILIEEISETNVYFMNI